MKYWILLLLSVHVSHAQICIKGITRDADNKESLPFVNIGIKNKNIGTVSNENGAFSLCIYEKYINDTLTFYLTGYNELNLPINTLDKTSGNFFLESKNQALTEVTITSKKLSEKKLGLSRNPLLHFVDASIPQKDIFEIAQLIKLGKNTAKINSVNLLVDESKVDSGTFRINFYHYDGQRPTDKMIERSIIRTTSIRQGWLQFELSKEGVYLQGDIIVAIEFIPAKTLAPVRYEIKPAGGARSFVRSSSLGTWQVPPHNYRMYITVMSTDAPSKDGEETEEEPKPTFKIYSKAVNDSFSVFVKLPQNYQSKNIRNYIYLLDANLYFKYVADSLEKAGNKNTVLVGIGYDDFLQMDSLRNRDYTYPTALLEDSFVISGGANKFYEFINDELIPYVDNRYHTQNAERTITGHSLGGYFTLYTLYKDIIDNRSLFIRYIAASPSIEYHNDYLIERYKEISKEVINNKSVHITWGGKEDDIDSKRKYTDIMQHYFELLSGQPFNYLKVSRTYFPNSEHMETSLPTFYNIITN